MGRNVASQLVSSDAAHEGLRGGHGVRGWGVILNIGSIAGTEPMTTDGCYAASKWGLRCSVHLLSRSHWGFSCSFLVAALKILHTHTQRERERERHSHTRSRSSPSFSGDVRKDADGLVGTSAQRPGTWLHPLNANRW